MATLLRPAPADLDTLNRVHRGHVHYIPYENFDVQFGRPLTRDTAAALEKIGTFSAIMIVGALCCPTQATA
jgi:arylamine N-acetyltransferase